jgi:hypothetical protein
MSYLSPARLIEAATEIIARRPNATLMKNGVGNFAIIDADDADDADGYYVGWLDLLTGEVHWEWEDDK